MKAGVSAPESSFLSHNTPALRRRAWCKELQCRKPHIYIASQADSYMPLFFLFHGLTAALHGPVAAAGYDNLGPAFLAFIPLAYLVCHIRFSLPELHTKVQSLLNPERQEALAPLPIVCLRPSGRDKFLSTANPPQRHQSRPGL